MISIIIPVLNESKKIESCLTHLKEHIEPKEVVVADGGSRDHTQEIV